METLAHGTRCENFFYQMNLNPARGEVLSPEEWERAREIAEKQHGLEGQPYFVVEHVKHGRPHQHIVWSRISVETGKTISDSNDARKNHAIARAIENEMGLEKVISPYDREEGQPRPPRAPKSWEMYRGMKTGIDPRDIATEVTELYLESRNGPEFQAALEQHGYQLVKGDRRAFVILDSAGKDHSLARRLNGVTTKELNRFMRDVDREGLLTVDQGKELFQERLCATRSYGKTHWPRPRLRRRRRNGNSWSRMSGAGGTLQNRNRGAVGKKKKGMRASRDVPGGQGSTFPMSSRSKASTSNRQ
jgi:hypothetical protein